MKKFIIDKCMNYIKNNTNYNETKLSEIRYGLVSIYLMITKLIIIFALSILLDIFKEVLMFLVIYNILRTPSFGLHATKSWICLLSSTLLFIGIPYLCLNLNIPIIIKSFIGVAGICFMFKNSPADTYKKPIVSKKRRERYKFISTVICCIMALISIYIKDSFISNCLVFSIIIQNLMISPTVYKIFNLPYNNYIEYLKKHPEFSN